MPTRRKLLSGGAASALALAFAAPPGRASEPLPGLADAAIRSTLSAAEYGLRPDSSDDQSAALRTAIEKAAEDGRAVFLPPGTYRISRISLPKQVDLTGVFGQTRLVFGGNGFVLRAKEAENIVLSNLLVDGAGIPLSDEVQGLLDLRGVKNLVIDRCRIVGSGGYGIATERCAGAIERTSVSDAAEAGIYCVGSTGMRITDNVVADCGNGGILVHRWEAGEGGTMVTGNRVTRIRADSGGTGQNGNGINIYRAGNVIVSNNNVSDCAFSAVRANSASDVQITGNNCLRSGETAIYSEFSFQGAVIASNMVDGAANGISMVNLDQGGRIAACAGNIVRNLSRQGPYAADPPGFGVGINVEADSTVTGNVIENAPTFGMAIGWGPFMRNVVATGNVIRKAGTGIAVSVVDGAGKAIISNNIFAEMGNGAVVGYRWAEAVTGDLAKDDAEGFPNLMIEGNQAG